MRQERHDELLVVGRVVGLLGIKGWVKIESFTEPRENIQLYSPWQLQLPDKVVELEVEEMQRRGKGIAAKLAGIDDRDQAAELLRCDIQICADQLQELESGQLYWRDLIGLNVINCQGEMLGQVESLFETGANDVMVVSDGQQEILIPYVPDKVVVALDRELKQLKVDWQRDWL